MLNYCNAQPCKHFKIVIYYYQSNSDEVTVDHL